MQCYTELTPPTAVTHSLSLPFLSSESRNLLVAKATILQIFSVKNVSEDVDVTANEEQENGNERCIGDRREGDEEGFESSYLVADSALIRSERTTSTKLVLVAEYPLSGTVTSMVRIKTLNSKFGGHSALIGFRDAKLSLIEWDPERNGLSTTSIHYFEQEELNGSPWSPDIGDCINFLAADPMSRCAALKFGVRNLAIMPFKQADDDIAMDDWDEDLDGPRPVSAISAPLLNGDSKPDAVPYGSSFVLRFSSLDPSIIFPVHIAFLHEYREPTFGILSSTVSSSASLLHERKDHLAYMVFTLDMEQKASTTILAVPGLPYDLYKVLALPTPVGGALLVGGNELVHIDQSGKTNGVAVNTFAKQCTSFALSDQSSLGLRLEGCTIEQLSIESGEMLVILSDGGLCILSFRMDGRSVSGLSLRRISSEMGGNIIKSASSCASLLGKNTLFVGSEGADSSIIGWSRKSKQVQRRQSDSNAEGLDDAQESDIEEDLDADDDDDDLYGDAPLPTTVPGAKEVILDSANSKVGDFAFRVHDTIFNIAPLRDITLSQPSTDTDLEELRSDLQVVAASGTSGNGSLVIMKREIEPNTIGRFDFQEARGMWTINAKQPLAKSAQEDKGSNAIVGDDNHDAQFDRLMIVSKSSEDSAEESSVYALTAAGFEALTGTEFEPAAGATIEAGTMCNGKRIVQVLRSEVRIYDGNLGLAQILPMFDDETGAEPKIVSASIADPFLLLLRDDASIYVAQSGSDNELEELEKIDDVILTTKWLSGCLYTDTSGMFASIQTDKGLREGENVMMFLLSADGSLFVYALPNLSEPVYKAEGICFLPTTISPQYAMRRSPARETLTELLVANLGDEVSNSPYMILRSASDDIALYEPFRKDSTTLSSALHFAKVHNPQLAKSPEVAANDSEALAVPQGPTPMRAISSLGRFSSVFVPGESPSFILKSSKSIPRVIGLRGLGVRGLSPFHTAGCDHGFIYVDSGGIARVSELPHDTNYELGLPTRRVQLGADVSAVAYHPKSDTYVVSTSSKEPFELPRDDDHHREWAKEDTSFKPLLERSSIRLISPTNWTIIDTVELDAGETVMCIKNLNLEVSEDTHERQQLITVGTAVSKGEDLAIKGCVYVFNVVIVVPEPGRPETNRKLKLVAKEVIPRGAVTSITEVGSQGFMMIAQGQKCMVRGLKEDGTLLPVAFMDMNTYVTTVKELPGSGICVLADALKGVWLAGYAEEPYKMMLFGKQTDDMEIVSAEILPIGDQLYIVAADSDCNLHVLQYDPEHPKSLHGQRLLHRTTFSLGGHIPTTMTLLPRTKAATIIPLSEDAMDTAADETIPQHEILLTLTSGSLALLTPVSESEYRRLNTLTNHLCNTLYHACGLNPKAHRISYRAPEPVIGGRPIVDGTIMMRWMELGTQKRAEVANRIGVDAEQVRDDLEMLMGGIGYL